MSSLIPTDNFSKMLLWIFLGMLLLIFVFGFHKSPQASATAGQRETQMRLASASRTPTGSRATYPSDKSMYK